ncbi:MAG: DNA-directed RNA polymerase subunit alpha [Desulfobacteraceae bacterium]|nr:DNA-directed RNA polymerase subunit alpha [Desulfobacteraceae bacterium]
MPLNELTYMNWRDMIRPGRVEIDQQTATYGKFVWEPLERGFGITIGNSLRRIILSSLYGAAITSVKIEGVMHEYSAVPGVLEDVSEIMLNLKKVRVKTDDAEPRTMTVEAKGERTVTAADIVSGDGRVEVLNPTQHIATLTSEGNLQMTLTVQAGKSYSLAEANRDPEAPVGTLPIDAIFSPIYRVNYLVGNARVGQRTDYDKLTMEIWTDGSVKPMDAIAYAAKILKEQMHSFINFDEDQEPSPPDESQEESTPQFNPNLYLDVDELELSVRSANCLRNANIRKIYQLVQKTENEMLKTKNFGRKSLNEIKELLSEMGLSLGMKLEGFVPPDDDQDQKEE